MERLHLGQHIARQVNSEIAARTRQGLAMGGLVEAQLATALEALAARVADYTAFMQAGRLLEFDTTDRIFTNPRLRGTEDYITGRMRETRS